EGTPRLVGVEDPFAEGGVAGAPAWGDVAGGRLANGGRGVGVEPDGGEEVGVVGGGEIAEEEANELVKEPRIVAEARGGSGVEPPHGVPVAERADEGFRLALARREGPGILDDPEPVGLEVPERVVRRGRVGRSERVEEGADGGLGAREREAVLAVGEPGE